MKTGDYILLHSGYKFYFSKDPKDIFENSIITIQDISWSLAGKGRFCDHTKKMYTVAEHCLLMADVIPDPWKREALMHDRSEAYTGDLTTPLKRLIPEYREYERAIEQATGHNFGLEPEMPYMVKVFDIMFCILERDAYMLPDEDNWVREAEATEYMKYFGLGVDIIKCSPYNTMERWRLAEEFEKRYRELVEAEIDK